MAVTCLPCVRRTFDFPHGCQEPRGNAIYRLRAELQPRSLSCDLENCVSSACSYASSLQGSVSRCVVEIFPIVCEKYPWVWPTRRAVNFERVNIIRNIVAKPRCRYFARIHGPLYSQHVFARCAKLVVRCYRYCNVASTRGIYRRCV